MLQNYLKIAFRNLWRNKVFAFINISGLAIGFACCMLISSFLYSELSYDKFPANAKNIYRVELNVENKDFYSAVDVGVGQGMKDNFPEIENTTKCWKWNNVFIKHDDAQFKEPAIAIAEANFFDFFSIPLSQGNSSTALSQPGSMVISQEYATKYFGKENPVGKSIIVNGNTAKPYHVTAVLDKMPGDLHFHFDIYVYMPPARFLSWSNIGSYTYLQLKPGTDPAKLEAKFPQLVEKYVVPEVQHDMGVSLSEAQKSVSTPIRGRGIPVRSLQTGCECGGRADAP